MDSSDLYKKLNDCDILPQLYLDIVPATTVVVPVGHFSQVVERQFSEYVPDGQMKHGERPFGEYSPGLQSPSKNMITRRIIKF